jgi:hypothetical protein
MQTVHKYDILQLYAVVIYEDTEEVTKFVPVYQHDCLANKVSVVS